MNTFTVSTSAPSRNFFQFLLLDGRNLLLPTEPSLSIQAIQPIVHCPGQVQNVDAVSLVLFVLLSNQETDKG
jgi:hypothetical protein